MIYTHIFCSVLTHLSFVRLLTLSRSLLCHLYPRFSVFLCLQCLFSDVAGFSVFTTGSQSPCLLASGILLDSLSTISLLTIPSIFFILCTQSRAIMSERRPVRTCARHARERKAQRDRLRNNAGGALTTGDCGICLAVSVCVCSCHNCSYVAVSSVIFERLSLIYLTSLRGMLDVCRESWCAREGTCLVFGCYLGRSSLLLLLLLCF